jgi:hypothetical protein
MNTFAWRLSGSFRCLFITLLLTACLYATKVHAAQIGYNPSAGAVVATITGRVTHENGSPVPGCTIRAIPALLPFFAYTRNWPNTALTGPDGRYRLSIRPLVPMAYEGLTYPKLKGYSLLVICPDPELVPPPAKMVDPSTYPQNTMRNVDFVLHLGPIITVHFRDVLTGAPSAGMVLTASKDEYSPGVSCVSGSNGVCQMRVPLTTFYVRVLFPYQWELPPGVYTYGDLPDPVVALPGKRLNFTVQTYPRDNIPGLSIGNNIWHGIVLQQNGQPAPDATIQIVRWGFPEADTLTNLKGIFSVSLPPFTSFETNYNPPTITAIYEMNRATFRPTPQETRNGMTIHLQSVSFATVTGRAVDVHGKPLAGVPVYDGRPSPVPGVPFHVFTGPDGRFQMTGLPPQTYYSFQVGGSGPVGQQKYVPFAITDVPAEQHPEMGPGFPDETYLKSGAVVDFGNIVVLRNDQFPTFSFVGADGRQLPYEFSVSITGVHTETSLVYIDPGQTQKAAVPKEKLTVSVFAIGDRFKNPISQESLQQFTIRPATANFRLVVTNIPKWDPIQQIPRKNN